MGFIIFLAVFFSLYSGLHAYGFIKLKSAFPDQEGRPVPTLLGIKPL